MPFADLLDSQSRSWSNATIIWAVRNETEYEVLEHSLCMRVKAIGRIHVQVYITRPTRDSLRALESDPPADQVQANEKLPDVKPQIGLALQSRLLTGIAPGLVLLLTLKMHGVIADMSDRPSWNDNVFKWSLATHGSVLMLAYAAIGLSAYALGLLVCALWRVAGRVRSHLPEAVRHRARMALPLQQGQATPHAERHQFLIKGGRPDITAIVHQVAEEGTTLSICACGTKSLLDAVCVATSKEKATGRKVRLHIEQSEW